MNFNLQSQTVLVLNKYWQAIHVKNPMDAISMMYTNNAVALHVEGDSLMQPLSWKQWIELPYCENEYYVNTVSLKIRVPKIIILSKFSKVPLKRPKLTKKSIWKRDNFTCQYTGKKIKEDEGNIDHVLPKSKGGSSDWTNLVLACKDVNQRKGDKTPEQAGLTLIKQPTVPTVNTATNAIENKFNIKEWDMFLNKKHTRDS